MFSRKTIWFLIFILVISLFLFNINTVKVELFSNNTVIQSPSPENNKQIIEPLTKSSQQPKAVLVEEASNEGYIVECSQESFVEEEGYIEAQQQYLQSLFNSTSQDRQLEYVLFAQLPSDKSRLELLLEYNDKFPNNSLALMEAVSLCANTSNSKCNKSLIDLAIASDKDNGAMWLHSAIFFASQNDDDGVLTSISGLIKTPFFNEKYGERIKLFAQAVEGGGAYDFHTNIVGGIGIESARSIGFTHIFNWCKEGGAITKTNACLKLGRNLEKRSKTVINQVIGMSIQKLIHKAEGNLELEQSLEKASKRLLNPLNSIEFRKASSLMFNNEKLLHHWLDNFDLIGEVESAEVLIEEAIYISQEKGTNLCKTSELQ
ncbi:MAG: hypothetical protein OQK09_05440 [Colwellia sp.]|nr:hypothetical protein [Colwellia sp.]MCW8863322.1 hypothetical protein [Colwellia sp.]MCW9080936.1 hypothetical protein [Colwellia sp.]